MHWGAAACSKQASDTCTCSAARLRSCAMAMLSVLHAGLSDCRQTVIAAGALRVALKHDKLTFLSCSVGKLRPRAQEFNPWRRDPAAEEAEAQQEAEARQQEADRSLPAAGPGKPLLGVAALQAGAPSMCRCTDSLHLMYGRPARRSSWRWQCRRCMPAADGVLSPQSQASAA